ncbi:protein dpy-30 [Emericellopsis cladophorae]|uniref:Protein dpy-30 n=1 Tax=Emericellopsis cladophorae TaxID=2686198 RepID=A0A9P9Y663_9HYPO|nr:protein dpy-30 [Emericellopsis cladophorae]KAI6783765.1 protein dpy-30 [Emericellopsis cladophorae]
MADENARDESVTDPPVPATSAEEPIADGTPLKDTLMTDATFEQPGHPQCVARVQLPRGQGHPRQALELPLYIPTLAFRYPRKHLPTAT